VFCLMTVEVTVCCPLRGRCRTDGYRQNKNRWTSSKRDGSKLEGAFGGYDRCGQAHVSGSQRIAFFPGTFCCCIIGEETFTHNQLLGHSMGAGPTVSACPELQKLGYTVSGVVVIDVVEGW
jgi:hypothetical protein